MIYLLPSLFFKNSWYINTRVYFKEVILMVQFTVRVNYQGKVYQTNVLAHREDAEEEIYNRAFEQVQRQWKE